ncbi:MAG: hypothetical protein VXZ82_14710 [Planctomycetota bacterium]|nr:hypothetical protein [Planctomycetota bacterium]
MAMTESENDSLQLDGGPLGLLSFLRSGERYLHRWSFPDSSVNLDSVESSLEEAWPSSPPLQQIHSQSFADGREVIFGVGMAGRGHWSASFTLVPDLKCWIVELACRSSVAAEKLSSSYQWMAEGVEPLADQDVCSEAITLDSSGKITLEAIAPSSVASIASQQISFRPVQIGEGASTTQWAFRLRVEV